MLHTMLLIWYRYVYEVNCSDGIDKLSSMQLSYEAYCSIPQTITEQDSVFTSNCAKDKQ